MKKVLLSAIAVIAMTQTASAADTLGEALKNGDYSMNARVFYFNRSFDNTAPRARALTAGGIMKYVSGDFMGLKMGLAYYGSARIGGFYTRDEGSGTSILGRSGEDLNFLGEAYLEYNTGNTMIKVGRQQLATPLIQNHDLRVLPSVYEAAIIRNKDIANTMLEVGYIKAYTGFTSKENDFLDKNTNWGDNGLAYVSFKNSSIENLTIRGQYVLTLSDEDNAGNTLTSQTEDYRYLDAKYALTEIGTKTYIKLQYGGNSYANADDSTLIGAKAGTTVGMFDLALLFDQISDNRFRAVESGPMYSDWQQGYGNYEASTAFGGQIVAHPMAGLSVKVGYVDVAADEGNVRDDFAETNVDIKYKLTDYSKVRVRYSLKDQTDESDREDRDDFRVIYYLNF